MSPFPNDLITDILCRLQVKTLIRFKCLSKPWGSLIDDPDFAKLHLHQSLKTNTNVKLLLDSRIENDDKAYSVDFDSLSNLVQIPRPFPAETTKYVSRIIGSCNGILAVHHCEAGIALWNPSTRNCHYLPPLDQDITMDHDNRPGIHHDNNTLHGFGYDLIGHDYKVVRMFLSKTQNCFKVMVYSLKRNSWKRIKDCPYVFNTYFYANYSDGAYVNGSLHWVGDKRGTKLTGKGIFALDLGTEEYYEVPLGDTGFRKEKNKHGADGPSFGYINAGVLGGCLCVSRLFSTYLFEDVTNYLVMEEYGVEESWTQLFDLLFDQWPTDIFHSRLIAYSRSGDKVLLDDGGDVHHPVWFNLVDETGETLSIPGAPQRFSTTLFVETLVSLN